MYWPYGAPPSNAYIFDLLLQALMLEEDSPVKDYYPINFETDLNGKLQEWEAVVLIPFINEVSHIRQIFLNIVIILLLICKRI